MGQVSGLDVARVFKSTHQPPVVVLLTGWGVELGDPEISQSGVDRVMAKPLKMDELKACLAECVQSRQGEAR